MNIRFIPGQSTIASEQKFGQSGYDDNCHHTWRLRSDCGDCGLGIKHKTHSFSVYYVIDPSRYGLLHTATLPGVFAPNAVLVVGVPNNPPAACGCCGCVLPNKPPLVLPPAAEPKATVVKNKQNCILFHLALLCIHSVVPIFADK